MNVPVSLDSNILVYAALEAGSEKGKQAARTIELAAPRCILTVQALLEFLAVVRRREPTLTSLAVDQVVAWAGALETAPTTDAIMSSALVLVRDHKFQVWDAVIWSAARAAGATVLFSEDMQHGFALDGMRAVNPFALSETELQALL
ncbi:MAG: PIN domain-containing protein [Hyphomonadaceae bacterium]